MVGIGISGLGNRTAINAAVPSGTRDRTFAVWHDVDRRYED